jgi:hypothetical protein
MAFELSAIVLDGQWRRMGRQDFKKVTGGVNSILVRTKLETRAFPGSATFRWCRGTGKAGPVTNDDRRQAPVEFSADNSSVFMDLGGCAAVQFKRVQYGGVRGIPQLEVIQTLIAIHPKYSSRYYHSSVFSFLESDRLAPDSIGENILPFAL